MEARLKIFKTMQMISAALLCLWLFACTHAQKRPEVQVTSNPPAGTVGPPARPSEIYGPPAPSYYGPESPKKKSLTLVFGPGMARGYGYAGVLRALSQNKIPIAAIFATQVGGLLGSIYAVNGNINHFEFGLLKFKDDVYEKPGGLLSHVLDSSSQSDGQQLENSLKQVFKHKNIETSKIPIRIAVQYKKDNWPTILDHGSFVDALRSSLAQPTFFTPGEVQREQAIAPADAESALVLQAKALGMGPVVVFDAAPEQRSPVDIQTVKQADLVIDMDLNSVPDHDFKKMTDAAYIGKSVTLNWIPQIKNLLGIP